MFLRWLRILLVVSVALAACACAIAADNPYADVLKKNGIEPTGPGALAYLDRIRPTPEAREKIAALVEQLNAFLHADRHRAEKRLFELGLLARPQIEKAARSDIAETAFRAERLLRKLERTNQELVLRGALETVRIEKPKDAARRVLAVAPLCSLRYLRRAAQRALKAVAGPGDADRLRRALEHENTDVRVIAIPALAALLGPERADELEPLLEDGEPAVRLAAARALADLGVRKTLGAFVTLMSHDDVRVRSRAHA
ncbi:MAG: HEAT repeat domain-containing protein, partial [Planctomycetota bacterium]